ncbi:transporter substrate-binding domain-containing protein [Pseudoalteromonas sp. JBTF-M23]|uniref:Transporter substrate-binding domain-containing protein n=1 Tax=Pseudoalteromonas caenipelagi TaxID=2726988 RepID=A0A849VC97_9GAMM|nr:transporter substrate-binding domain-containing protein [Pseudoalteromonas caenipelagi]NOU49321.1 transporter substrate-binding domain-containing protein [Pseudoalteromonas caenipelagi]
MLRTCIFILLLLPLSTLAKSITWIYVDFAPYYILDGAKKGFGRDERVIQLLDKALPSYDFKFVTLPASRAIHELSSPKNLYCMISIYKTPQRAQHIDYTVESSTIGLSPSLAIRRSTLQRLNLELGQQVSIRELIHRYQLTLGISASRSFGGILDGIIDTIPPEQLVSRPGKDPLMSLTKMLLKKRVDITLGYPSEHYHMQQLLDDDYQLSQLTIKETESFAQGYVGCTKQAQTPALINELNSALKTIKATRAFSDAMLYWLPTELQPTLTSKLIQQSNDTPEG